MAKKTTFLKFLTLFQLWLSTVQFSLKHSTDGNYYKGLYKLKEEDIPTFKAPTQMSMLVTSNQKTAVFHINQGNTYITNSFEIVIKTPINNTTDSYSCKMPSATQPV